MPNSATRRLHWSILLKKFLKFGKNHQNRVKSQNFNAQSAWNSKIFTPTEQNIKISQIFAKLRHWTPSGGGNEELKWIFLRDIVSTWNITKFKFFGGKKTTKISYFWLTHCKYVYNTWHTANMFNTKLQMSKYNVCFM